VSEIQQDMVLRDLISTLDRAVDDIRAVLATYQKKLDRSDIILLKQAAKNIASAAERIVEQRYATHCAKSPRQRTAHTRAIAESW
jgi:hypothetical protein